MLFSLVQAGDDYSLMVDGTLSQAGAIPLSGVENFAITGHQFDFGVMGRDDDYRLQQIVVDDLSDSSAPVPEPATWVLLLVGLVGLVGRYKLRR